MNFDLDEFGLDEPLLDEVQHQDYSAFLLDQPLDLFDDLNGGSESQDSGSQGSSGICPSVNLNHRQFSINDATESSTQDSFASTAHMNVLAESSQQSSINGTYRRDSSDESDVGIVDDIVIPTVHAATSFIPKTQMPTIGSKRSANGVAKITYPPQAFAQPASQVPTTIIKLEPLGPQTPLTTLPLTVLEDKHILPKSCLVISPTGALTPFSIQQTSTNVVNVQDVKVPRQRQRNNMHLDSATRAHQDELDRQAKKQLRILKNREAATLSRQRQKAYLESLEERVRILAQENEQVKQENEAMRKLVEQLHEENMGLKNGGGSFSSSAVSAYSTSSSVSSHDEMSPVSIPSHDSPTFSFQAPSPPCLVQPIPIAPKPTPVVVADDEPVPKKIQLIKPQPIINTSVPVITVPVSIVGTVVKPQSQPTSFIPATTTISRDNKTNISYISAVKVEKRPSPTPAATLTSQATNPPVKRVLIAARPNNKVLFLVSMVFAFNFFPLASKLFRDATTTSSPVTLDSTELNYNLPRDSGSLEPVYGPAPQTQYSSKILDGGTMNYPTSLKRKREAAFSSSGNDLMIWPPAHKNSYFEYDLDDDNNLPLMDDALLEDGDDRIIQSGPLCPTAPVNATHSQKIVNALSQWASLQQQKPRKMRPQPGPMADPPRRRANRVIPTSDVQLYPRRPNLRTVQPADDSLAQYEKFAKTIRQSNDTFYMVSFHVDQLIFPALVHNRTSRPKMSLILPALFSLNETVSPPEGSIALMQIECEISDMKVLHLGKHLIPLDVVMRHMREGNMHADGTNRLYRQWLLGKQMAPGAA